MEPKFAQASDVLDQAILSYSGGQIEEAAGLIAAVAAMLHEIQLAPAESRLEPEAFEPVKTESAAEGEINLAASELQPEPAVLRPMDIESTRESSVAVAA